MVAARLALTVESIYGVSLPLTDGFRGHVIAMESAGFVSTSMTAVLFKEGIQLLKFLLSGIVFGGRNGLSCETARGRVATRCNRPESSTQSLESCQTGQTTSQAT